MKDKVLKSISVKLKKININEPPRMVRANSAFSKFKEDNDLKKFK